MAETRKIDKFRYGIETISVAIPDLDPIEIKPDRIKSFIIDRDYDRNILPKFKLNITIYKYDYFTILENINKAKFTIRITKSKYKNHSETFKKNYITLTMVAIPNNNTPNTTTKMDKAKYETISKDGSMPLDNFMDVQLSLFDLEGFKSFKTMININATTNVASLLAYTFTKAGFKMLMSPPDNKAIKHMIIPEQDTQDVLDFIHQTYGIYNTGYRLFYDLDRILYLMNNEYDSKAFIEGDIKNIFLNISEFTTNDATVYGSYTENESYHITVSSKDIEVLSSSSGMKEVSTTKYKTINSSGKTVESKEDIDGFDSGDTTTVLEDKNDNTFYLKSKIHKLKESGTIIEFTAPEIDISMITLNRRYNLVYQGDDKMNKTIGGTYKISRIITLFELDANMFSVNNGIQLKKV